MSIEVVRDVLGWCAAITMACGNGGSAAAHGLTTGCIGSMIEAFGCRLGGSTPFMTQEEHVTRSAASGSPSSRLWRYPASIEEPAANHTRQRTGASGALQLFGSVQTGW